MLLTADQIEHVLREHRRALLHTERNLIVAAGHCGPGAARLVRDAATLAAEADARLERALQQRVAPVIIELAPAHAGHASAGAFA